MRDLIDVLDPLEVASHVLIGRDEQAARLIAEVAPAKDPRAAIEECILRQLERPPAVVSFSGGRDSSALLAVAVHVARREGLHDPVPVTVRAPSADHSVEDEWQELVIRHLGLSDWIRLTFDDELDLVGPVAQTVMSGRVLPYPYNLHLQAPILEVARGGSVVTGLGGDEALSAAPPRSIGERLRRRRRLQTPLTFPWLRETANAQLASRWRAETARLGVRASRRVGEWWLSRYVQQTVHRIDRLAQGFNVLVAHPFAEPQFVRALPLAFGRSGIDRRESAVERLFGDVLPDALPGRSTKANFDGVLWNRHAESFLDELVDSGLENALDRLGVADIVDATALEAHWRGPARLANSFLLLQGCWLETRMTSR
jgi:asparagine synthase (glutamine-hydrolysing)